MTDKLDEKQKKIILDKIPMKRFGNPNEIANLVYFLSGNESDYITGQNFHINGGMLMV
jgi:3-oxoacyl-[acyl-carrier protein] reductase